jgi:hypothetical protein
MEVGIQRASGPNQNFTLYNVAAVPEPSNLLPLAGQLVGLSGCPR